MERNKEPVIFIVLFYYTSPQICKLQQPHTQKEITSQLTNTFVHFVFKNIRF